MATSVASVRPVRDRSASPITRLYRPIDASTLARRLWRLAFCQTMRPRSAIIRRWRSRCVGAVPAEALATAPARGGTMTPPSVRMTPGNHLADPVLIVGAVGSEGRNGIGDPAEQRASHRGIVDILPGHLDGDDPAADGIDADMQLAPRPAAERAVLFNQPFAGSAELQAGAVHEQMQRTGTGPPERRHLQRLGPAAQRG